MFCLIDTTLTLWWLWWLWWWKSVRCEILWTFIVERFKFSKKLPKASESVNLTRQDKAPFSGYHREGGNRRCSLRLPERGRIYLGVQVTMEKAREQGGAWPLPCFFYQQHLQVNPPTLKRLSLSDQRIFQHQWLSPHNFQSTFRRDSLGTDMSYELIL